MNNIDNRLNEIPDYTGSCYWSKVLASKLEKFYHDKGYRKVKFFVDKKPYGRNFIYSVRSNIKFSAPKV